MASLLAWSIAIGNFRFRFSLFRKTWSSNFGPQILVPGAGGLLGQVGSWDRWAHETGGLMGQVGSLIYRILPSVLRIYICPKPAGQ